MRFGLKQHGEPFFVYFPVLSHFSLQLPSHGCVIQNFKAICL